MDGTRTISDAMAEVISIETWRTCTRPRRQRERTPEDLLAMARRYVNDVEDVEDVEAASGCPYSTCPTCPACPE
jgi:hypothetical protein